MKFIKINRINDVACLTLNRGKVNALNGDVIDEMRNALQNLENDSNVRAVIITGENKFFSFGFDVPEFYSYSKEEFSDFLTRFTDLYTYIFTYSKPVVGAL
jgi:3,2-trans-enoyl-CoA isomerase